MKKLFTAKKYLPLAIALVGLAAVGTATAFAQSLPSHYLSDGTIAKGWNAETLSVRQAARAPSTSGKNAFAEAPATLLQSAAHSPATDGYNPGESYTR